ncbi:hypothetical protein CAPI_01615 [Corynebacterium capitovis DSM 44611]|uniref:hypothetical protein n=1 Tax=Corynebacterium capitovis TaxID=131081 RepID=UPI0003694FDF|nr:hypothetical protein [Corynebacterium capitovis]WKD56897.1 hypothetical protein CAPI_01615 [Corynebacterium capitovis DSM 44611]
MSKSSVSTAVARLRKQQEAREEAERREAEERREMLLALGEVLEASSVSPRSRWHAYRERPLAELLVAVGLEEGGASDSASDEQSGGDDGAPANDVSASEDGGLGEPDQPHGAPWG